jgi:hypothetical protein
MLHTCHHKGKDFYKINLRIGPDGRRVGQNARFSGRNACFGVNGKGVLTQFLTNGVVCVA